MAAWDRLQRNHPASLVVVATGDSPEQIREMLATEIATNQYLKLKILRDPLNSAAKAFNARWLPRAYALDQHGRIAYVQPDSASDVAAVFDIEHGWKANRFRSTREPGH